MAKEKINPVKAQFDKVIKHKKDFTDKLNKQGCIYVLDNVYGNSKPYIRKVPCTSEDSISFNEFSMDIYHDIIGETAEYDYSCYGSMWAFSKEDLSEGLAEAFERYNSNEEKEKVERGRMTELKVDLMHGVLNADQQRELANLMCKYN